MLHAKSNRINYAELLSPPEGYELARAIGTTYSLDLYALLAMPVAMFYADSLDGDFKQDRYDVLEALRQCSKKVSIYCQSDKLKVPKQFRTLFAFIDNCVELIQPPIVRASFHPKLWVLRFESEEQPPLYRLAVLSRNLTFDQSWDIAIYTEGLTGKKNKESVKLSQFLQQFATDESVKKDATFFSDLERINFVPPNGFDSLDLMPILGFNNQIKKFPNPLEKASYDSLLAISPFLDNNTLHTIKKQVDRLTVLSRLEELQKLNQDILKEVPNKFCAYYMNTGIVEGASWLDTEGEEPPSHNLHAKIFVGEKDEATEWLVGSANFTDPAFTRNAEMMVRLHSDTPSTAYVNVLDKLTNKEQLFFLKYEPLDEPKVDELKEAKENLRVLLYELIAMQSSAFLEKNDLDKYDLHLSLDLRNIKITEAKISIRPFHRKAEANQELVLGEKNELCFDNIALSNLSPFLVCTVRYHDLEEQLLLKLQLEMPDERDDEIFKGMIGNKVRFLEYLQFLLSPSTVNNTMGYSGYEGDPKDSNNISLSSLLGMHNDIYESLLLTASRQPKKLKQIDEIINSLQKIDPEIVADFMPIWSVYKEFIHE